MNKRLLLFCLLCWHVPFAHAQYAPQATLPGSTALHKSSASIVAWATQCRVQRGFQDIANPSLGYASMGDSSMAVGIADGNIVSLGDSGVAILTFAQPITNGAGYDFAVFENGFANPQNAAEAYMELATVAVSSDGVHFYDLPAHSLTPVDAQVAGAGVYMNASLVNNLAGKYVAQYGTPFDLQALAHLSSININAITHVKITDVVGAIRSPYGTKDTAGNFINDPYPTPFPTGGFDLDAVAVLHSLGSNGFQKLKEEQNVFIAPNPASHTITLKGLPHEAFVSIKDAMGKVIFAETIKPLQSIDIAQWTSGVYFITVKNSGAVSWQGRFLKY